MRKLIQICLLVVSFTSALAAQAPSIDWEREKAEILTHYRALIQINTSSPPGNETRVVEYLKKVFEDAGISLVNCMATALVPSLMS